MPKTFPHEFTHTHQNLDDGSVIFECSQDQKIWPWLALHPHDPIVLQTINYWAPVELGETRKTFDREKWTALTETTWSLGTPDIGKIVRGVAAPLSEPNSMDYDIQFFDEQDRLICHMTGKGVVFQNRDFEAWRNKAKAVIGALPKPTDFQYAASDLTGAAVQSQSFLSDLIDADRPTVQALITQENGFMPEHPHISGSGDHVNATHLAVAGQQFVTLLESGKQIEANDGTLKFMTFVELGHPFEISVSETAKKDKTIQLDFHQAGTLCASMTMDYSV